MKIEDIKSFDEYGKRHGYWEEYYENGQLGYKGNYIHGKKYGYWEEYHNNSKILKQVNYLDGYRYGHYYEFYYDGVIQYECYYVRDLKVGLTRHYNPDGTLHRVFLYDKIPNPLIYHNPKFIYLTSKNKFIL